MKIVSDHLDLLHQLVLSDLRTIAHYRTSGPLIHDSVRKEIYEATGFPYLEGNDADAPKAKQILEGPTFRLLWRLRDNEEYRVEWKDTDTMVELFDDPYVADAQFGGLTLKNGMLCATDVFEMSEILERSKHINS